MNAGGAGVLQDMGVGSHSRIMHYALSERKRLLHDHSNYALRMTSSNERLRQARIAAGYASQREAAKSLGVVEGTYNGHENGHRGFPASRAPAYARKFKVSEEWLLYGKGPGPGVANSRPEPEPEPAFALMPVAFPNEEGLMRMFDALLEDLVPEERFRDEIAQTLAQKLPTSLGRASSGPPARVRNKGTARGEDTPLRAKRHQPPPRESRT